MTVFRAPLEGPVISSVLLSKLSWPFAVPLAPVLSVPNEPPALFIQRQEHELEPLTKQFGTKFLLKCLDFFFRLSLKEPGFIMQLY